MMLPSRACGLVSDHSVSYLLVLLVELALGNFCNAFVTSFYKVFTLGC